MKIPIRTQAQLQRRIDMHVRNIETASRLFYKWRKQTKSPTFIKIYQAVANSPVPVDYRYVTAALGFPQTTKYHYPISGRLSNLAAHGYLKAVGEGPPRYRWKHGALLFVAVPIEQVPRVQNRIKRCIDRMLNDTELATMTYRANDVPQCLARRITSNGPNFGAVWRLDPSLDERDRRLIELRLTGMSLTKLGVKFGITRERCRQIVERAVTGKSVGRLATEKKGYKRGPYAIKSISRTTLRVSGAKGNQQSGLPVPRQPDRDEQLALDIIKKSLDNG